MAQCPPNKPWRVTYKDQAGNVIRFECYDQRPSIDGDLPDSRYQLTTGNNEQPYARCNCPDSEKRLVYKDANGNVYAEKDWSASSVGAAEVKGVKLCKHTYATLAIEGVLDQFIPGDYTKGIVEEAYNEEGLLGGQDTVWELQPDGSYKHPPGHVQTSKRWY